MIPTKLCITVNMVMQLMVLTNQCKEVHTGMSKLCPTWTYQEQDEDCKCGSSIRERVECNEITKEVKVLKCFCMTYSHTHNKTVLGNCIYSCARNSSLKPYYYVPGDYNQLNAYTCGSFNLRESMCSKCKQSYGIAAYSYYHACTECLDYRKNWIKYIAITFLPLTLLYLIVLITNLNITKSLFKPYIFFCQLLTNPIIATLYGFSTHDNMFIQAMVTLLGVWNLDFGRLIYEPFCLHPNMSLHHVYALDYLIVLYLLFLIVITCFLVKLHDKYILAVTIWKPFHFCMRYIQKKWNVRTSLINTFATFLLLSNVKLLNVSFKLISAPVILWDMHGNSMPVQYTYFNGSMEYLGKEHIPYFVLGVVVILVFNILPTLLLCLFPFRWFQRGLNCCSPSIHILMDAFQGSYKTIPRDYRNFSSLNLIVTLANFIMFYVTLNSSYFTLLGITTGFIATLILIARPYTSNTLNTLEGITYIILCLVAFTMNDSKELVHQTSKLYKELYYKLKVIIFIIPTFAVIFRIIHQLITKHNMYKRLIKSPLKKLCSFRKKDECIPLKPSH